MGRKHAQIVNSREDGREDYCAIEKNRGLKMAAAQMNGKCAIIDVKDFGEVMN